MSTEQRLALLWRATVATRSLDELDDSARAKACRARYRSRTVTDRDRAEAQRVTAAEVSHELNRRFP